MKMLSFPSSAALLVLAAGAAQPASAQHEPSPVASPAAQSSTPATDQPSPPTSADNPAQRDDAVGMKSPGPGGVVDDFLRTDTDRDGRISAKEYAASELAAVAMVAAGKRQGTETGHGGFSFGQNEGRPDQSKFFRRIDTDGDGYISRSELDASGKPPAVPGKR